MRLIEFIGKVDWIGLYIHVGFGEREHVLIHLLLRKEGDESTFSR